MEWLRLVFPLRRWNWSSKLEELIAHGHPPTLPDTNSQILILIGKKWWTGLQIPDLDMAWTNKRFDLWRLFFYNLRIQNVFWFSKKTLITSSIYIHFRLQHSWERTHLEVLGMIILVTMAHGPPPEKLSLTTNTTVLCSKRRLFLKIRYVFDIILRF